MASLAGDLPGFEEASRALFTGDEKAFQHQVRAWPADVRKHLLRAVRNASRLERADRGLAEL